MGLINTQPTWCCCYSGYFCCCLVCCCCCCWLGWIGAPRMCSLHWFCPAPLGGGWVARSGSSRSGCTRMIECHDTWHTERQLAIISIEKRVLYQIKLYISIVYISYFSSKTYCNQLVWNNLAWWWWWWWWWWLWWRRITTMMMTMTLMTLDGKIKCSWSWLVYITITFDVIVSSHYVCTA